MDEENEDEPSDKENKGELADKKDGNSPLDKEPADEEDTIIIVLTEIASIRTTSTEKLQKK